jgi:hypothetical protein
MPLEFLRKVWGRKIQSSEVEVWGEREELMDGRLISLRELCKDGKWRVNANDK